MTDKQIEELEGTLARYESGGVWEVSDEQRMWATLPALLSEVKQARSQRAAVDWATKAAGEVKAAGPQKTRPAREFLAEQQRTAVVDALVKARDQFRFYEHHHLAKATPDFAKAKANADFADMCDRALSSAQRTAVLEECAARKALQELMNARDVLDEVLGSGTQKARDRAERRVLRAWEGARVALSSAPPEGIKDEKSLREFHEAANSEGMRRPILIRKLRNNLRSALRSRRESK